MMIVAFIMFNLLIAVVLEQFSAVMKQDQAVVRPDHYIAFAVEWARFDPNCTHWISIKDLVVLLKRLPPPLGMREGTSPVHALGESLYIPSYKGRVHFVETVTALIRHAYDSLESDEGLNMSEFVSKYMDSSNPRPLPLITMCYAIQREFPSVAEFLFESGEDSSDVLQTYAAMRMQALQRGKMDRNVVKAKIVDHNQKKNSHLGALEGTKIELPTMGASAAGVGETPAVVTPIQAISIPTEKAPELEMQAASVEGDAAEVRGVAGDAPEAPTSPTSSPGPDEP